MMVTDPIADMLTRIRNGIHARHEAVEMPASKMKLELAKILKAEGYIKNFKVVQDQKQGLLKLFLKYDDDRQSAIDSIRRISKPGRRIYSGVDDIPKVKNGLGIAIISTSRGIMTDRRAREEKVGGEVLCTIW
jgi:small subunit ribosomal protein S8